MEPTSTLCKDCMQERVLWHVRSWKRREAKGERDELVLGQWKSCKGEGEKVRREKASVARGVLEGGGRKEERKDRVLHWVKSWTGAVEKRESEAHKAEEENLGFDVLFFRMGTGRA